jgi:hypothetical protein
MKNTRNRMRSTGGFTLVEFLMAAGITGVIAGACMLAFVAFQKCYELSMARSGVRQNIVRLFDALEIDLRNATAVVAAVSGSNNVLPLTLTLPQRYSDYETAGPLAGDPGRDATRLPPTFDTKTGKLGFSKSITVTYSLAPNQPSTQNVIRAVSWTSLAGAKRSAQRVIATVPTTTTVAFRDRSGVLLNGTSLAIAANVSAQSNSRIGRSAAPLVLASTVFLRTKALK